MKQKILLLSALILCLGCFNIISAVDQNVSDLTNAGICINESRDILKLMIDDNFPILRINETLSQAESFYDSQMIILKSNRKKTDFTQVFNYCEEIKKIRNDALVARDSFGALLKFYNNTVVPGMNTSSIDSIIDEISAEMKNERYENVPKLSERGSQELINVRSSYSALKLFMDSTSTGIKHFIIKNWKALLILIVLISAGYYVYRKRVYRWILNNKIENLKIRKKTIRDLIMNTQKDYFQYGKIPEGEYNIKTKKFADLILDIDRQIPLLQEQLAKIEKEI